jgi:hypothetical protein
MQAIHISKMTGKLESLKAISTNTTTNEFCIKQFLSNKDTICKNCYSHIMLNSYRKNMQACLQRNSDLLSSSILHQQQLPTILDLYFRFQAHGELINDIHFINLINICLKHENVELQNCTGQKCKDCLACYKFDTTTTIVEKVKKY